MPSRLNIQQTYEINVEPTVYLVYRLVQPNRFSILEQPIILEALSSSIEEELRLEALESSIEKELWGLPKTYHPIQLGQQVRSSRQEVVGKKNSNKKNSNKKNSNKKNSNKKNSNKKKDQIRDSIRKTLYIHQLPRYRLVNQRVRDRYSLPLVSRYSNVIRFLVTTTNTKCITKTNGDRQGPSPHETQERLSLYQQEGY